VRSVSRPLSEAFVGRSHLSKGGMAKSSASTTSGLLCSGLILLLWRGQISISDRRAKGKYDKHRRQSILEWRASTGESGTTVQDFSHMRKPRAGQWDTGAKKPPGTWMAIGSQCCLVPLADLSVRRSVVQSVKPSSSQP
jgi:hypothetical protein